MTDHSVTEGLQATEEECAAANPSRRRVSLDDIRANISHQWMFNAGEQLMGGPVVEEGNPLNVLTICILTLKNGFTIIGKSAPADPENFNRELGEKLAYEDAVRQVWPLMGYHLRQELFEQAV